MKITLIRPPYSHIPYELPLGITSLAAVLEKEGYIVSIIDFETTSIHTKDEIKKVIDKENPDVVGVSFCTYDRFNALKVINGAKELGVPIIIAGGVHVTFDTENTLRNIPNIDVAVLGEGEETIRELIQAIDTKNSWDAIKGIAYRRGEEIIINPPRPFISDLNELPFPAYHLLPVKKYYNYAVMGSRGCPYNCIFCASPEFWKRKVRFRSYKKIVDEISLLLKNYGPKEFDFKDDVLFLNREWVRNLCDELLERNINIKWNCLGRVNVVDKSLFKLMKKAGCSTIRFGIESGNEHILKVINKNITKRGVKHAVEVTKEASLEVGTLFMLGHPSETVREMEETQQFAIELNAEHYSFKPVDIYPGTQLFHIAVKEGLLPKDYNWFERGKYKAGFGTYDDVPSYESSQFSRKTLEDSAKHFYLRTFFNRLFTLKSLSDFNLSHFRTGIAFIPKSTKEALIFMSEIIREIKTKRTSKQRLLGLLFLIRYSFQKSNEKFKLKLRKLFQLNIG